METTEATPLVQPARRRRTRLVAGAALAACGLAAAASRPRQPAALDVTSGASGVCLVHVAARVEIKVRGPLPRGPG